MSAILEQHMSVPAELRERRQWVVWRLEPTRDGKLTKVPYRAGDTTRKASSTNAASWATCDQALDACRRDHCDGVGFVFTAGDPFVGCDLDHCRNAETGALLPAAQGIVEAFGTYQEASQSGTGVHLIMRGRKPASAGCKKPFENIEIEIYEAGRYFCMTGDRIGAVVKIQDCQTQLDELCGLVWPAKVDEPPSARTAPAVPLEDRELVEKMLAARNGHSIEALYRGDTSAYGDDHSAADAALLCQLAWWTNNDTDQMDRIFRASGLYREKWDRPDYRARSIGFAVESNGGAGYSPRRATVPHDEAPAPSSVPHRDHKEVGGATPVDPGYGDHRVETASSEPAAPAEPTGPFALTQLGNAERLAAYHPGKMCAVRGVDELRGYDPDRGVFTTDRGLLVRYACEMVRGMYREAGDGLAESAGSLRKHALKSESKREIDAMLDLARSLKALEAELDEFDADPEKLNTRSGMVDLATGELHPHSPAYRMTKVAGAAYAPGTPTPMWEAFLERIFAGDAKLIAFIQRLFGYALTGYIGEQIFAILYGLGANGKSVLVDALHAALGDYAATAAMKTFLTHRTEAVRTDLATLNGCRLVSASESKPGQVIDAATIKVVTGRYVTCRFNYARGEFTYTPRYLVILDTNYKPQVQCDDYAIKRRVLLVPFKVQIPEEEQDKKFAERLVDSELPGILAWAVAGATEYLKNGLQVPPEVRAATDAYRSEMDALHGFWGQLAFGKPGVYTTARQLRDALETGARENGVETGDLPKGSEWGRQLRERGAQSDKMRLGSKTVSVWRGVSIIGEDVQEPLA